VGGAEESRKGFGNLIPVKVVVRSAMADTRETGKGNVSWNQERG
jgi:hypothetical protein